ncbi:MAG: glycosyltransferase family 2 protein [Alphaproteobacteria bacterium]|nr:glycosyltransferase family 2 protein [Alphaproteobacteria bacterium]
MNRRRPGFDALRLSCVMPAYNEARNLPLVVPAVLAMLRTLAGQVELIVVNDGSRDDTVKVAQDLCAQHPELVFLDLSRNFGKEAAMTAGLEAARGDAVILMDADGQHPVDLLPTMVRHWQEGLDVVYAVRRKRDDQSALHGWLTQWFYRLINWGNRVNIPAHAGDFRLMDRRVVQALNAMPERNRFMKGLYAWVGFPSLALDYEPFQRQQGQSHFGLRSSFALALTGMLAFSTVPLRLLTLAGLLIACIAMAYGLWAVIEYFVWGISVPGYATIVVSIMFFSGIQLLSLGVLAEYVGRIYEEVKRRPSYVLKDRLGQGLNDHTGADRA